MADVFISYSSKDKEQVNMLLAELESHNITCWIAPRDIAGGSDYTADIPEAIDNCGIYLLYMTQNAQDSQWVHKELLRAVNKKKKVIPFLAETCTIAQKFSFPLEGAHWLDATKDWNDTIKQLIASTKAEQHGDNPIQTNGITGAENIPQQLYIKAVNKYSVLSLCNMAEHAENDIKTDIAFFQEHIQHAKEDNPDSQLILGKEYYYGKGLEKDVQKAVYWLTKASNHQNAHALYLLGKCFEEGKGVARNLAYAAHCYEQSASLPQAYPDAIIKTADCYRKGEGVTTNALKRAFWYREASKLELKDIEQVHKLAQVEFTSMYIQLLKTEQADIATDLRKAGYSLDDLDEEQISLIERLRKAQQREDSRESMFAAGALFFLILLIYEFMLGFNLKEVYVLPHSIITIALVLGIALLITPLFANISSRNKIAKVWISILIFTVVTIAVAACTLLVYWAGLWLGEHILNILLGIMAILLIGIIFFWIVDRCS